MIVVDHGGHGGHGDGGAGDLLGPLLAGTGLVLLLAAGAAYVGAACVVRRRGGRGWPAYRVGLAALGLGCVAAALVGPLAAWSHAGFTGHMAAHLLVGMVAPLLLVAAAPVTLALRVLPVGAARRLTRVLGGRVVRGLGHPVAAAVLNVGSLWVLYATPLAGVMLHDPVVHHLLLAHFLVAGYLLTAALVGVDPAPHRPGTGVRLVVLVLAAAGHAVLAKHLWAHPPAGVEVAEARSGALLMYYGGDVVELALAALLLAQWYAAAPARRASAGRAVATRGLSGRRA
ncbi:cytochrome c oxidase assembly protein [Nocardioides sp. ChNu-153]|uniref:cytochrome c oxidase assembly protein n=1 Tax=Nocardioides sp. ChNu-153 TaxID=2779364 RepID=UPI002658B231|nr:cytochrome c oxidase assembly protein [Nocardioides sp. ChNu-153]